MTGSYFLPPPTAPATDLSPYATRDTPSFTGQASFAGTAQLATGTVATPALTFVADTDTGLARTAANNISLIGGGMEVLRIVGQPTTVNAIRLDAASAGGYPILSAIGTDTHIGFNFNAKNNGGFAFNASGTQFAVAPTASSVNYMAATGATMGTAPRLMTIGTDSVIDIELSPKGAAGRVRFGTFTSGGDAPVTGWIEIRDSSGTLRKLAVIG